MIVLTQPKVRTQMTKSRIQMNQASGFRRSASDGVELALNVLPEDMVLDGSAALTITVDAVIYVHVALSLRRLISTRVQECDLRCCCSRQRSLSLLWQSAVARWVARCVGWRSERENPLALREAMERLRTRRADRVFRE